MKLYKTNKQALSIRKTDVKSFLNGLASNTMDDPRNAFLTIHGRIVVTFDQLQINDHEYLIVIEKQFVDDLLRHLDKFMKLGGVKVEQLNHNVYFDLENSAGNTHACSLRDKGDYCIEQKEGMLLITTRELKDNVSDEEFTAFRLDQHIPVQGIDFKDEMLLNVSTTEFVSFKKGCFLGQEPISKVYNRSKPTWRLVVKAFDDCTVEEQQKMTSAIIHPVTGRKTGFVFEKND
ncbi:MAG: hypothetical protein KBD53_06340 [Candidatus Omnitrophica bacterium]|nr:hypothetical protein [Candidatus Omnitrophota bacterium]